MSLAFLIMETRFTDGKVVLYTKFQSLYDINTLVNILYKNLGFFLIEVEIVQQILFHKESLPVLYSIVSPFNIPGLYKKN